MAEYIARKDVIDIIRSAGFWEREDMEVAITCVEQTQDADVAPVVHGSWEHLGGDEWMCTNCGYVISTDGAGSAPERKYCEECGARMDLEG